MFVDKSADFLDSEREAIRKGYATKSAGTDYTAHKQWLQPVSRSGGRDPNNFALQVRRGWESKSISLEIRWHGLGLGLGVGPM